MDRLENIERRLTAVEAQQRQENRTIAGIKHYLRVAAKYSNGSPEKVIEAIQAALLLASEYEGRDQKRRRR